MGELCWGRCDSQPPSPCELWCPSINGTRGGNWTDQWPLTLDDAPSHEGNTLPPQTQGPKGSNSDAQAGQQSGNSSSEVPSGPSRRCLDMGKRSVAPTWEEEVRYQVGTPRHAGQPGSWGSGCKVNQASTVAGPTATQALPSREPWVFPTRSAQKLGQAQRQGHLGPLGRPCLVRTCLKCLQSQV